jgi:hypothetical protein
MKQDTGNPPPRKYTLEERKKIQDLLGKGHKRNHIATFLGRHKKSLCKEVLKCVKVHGKYDAELAHEMGTSKRGGPTPRHLSLKQIELIREGLERGLSLHAMAALAGTSRKKVKEYAEQNGYSIAATALERRTFTAKDQVSFEQRILYLEEQVKILSETIKEILCQK